ncbi:uncharacterized protein STEHIDRAFT_122858 [Stereum hirsutum FP-91666 SS1]|uniref:uncharacterized protein n=1 Tax=Stereum hirsutum (strain FP-91666) TaxID=721885 RepID=UPI0004449D8E|nr:uncharacterized protein STEHIDRAFT_122858 [Stereum hirsutum FP-91666 SS1]EIM84925.1 hypothetical protein STEHIDRAFT_122858 [Stereum hirsutum FP-91666 SS1]
MKIYLVVPISRAQKACRQKFKCRDTVCTVADAEASMEYESSSKAVDLSLSRR